MPKMLKCNMRNSPSIAHFCIDLTTPLSTEFFFHQPQEGRYGCEWHGGAREANPCGAGAKDPLPGAHVTSPGVSPSQRAV